MNHKIEYGRKRECLTILSAEYVIWCALMCPYVPLCAVMSRYVPLCAVMSRYVPLCAVMCRYVPLCAVNVWSHVPLRWSHVPLRSWLATSETRPVHFARTVHFAKRKHFALSSTWKFVTWQNVAEYGKMKDLLAPYVNAVRIGSWQNVAEYEGPSGTLRKCIGHASALDFAEHKHCASAERKHCASAPKSASRCRNSHTTH